MADDDKTELQKAITENLAAFEALREEVKKGKEGDEGKIVLIEKALDDFEEKSQEATKAAAAAETKAEEQKERLDALEADLARATEGKAGDYKKTDEYKALTDYACNGEDRMKDESKALLETGVNTSGGYLVMSEMDDLIHKQIVEIDPFRSICRVKSVSAKTLEVPTRTGIPTANYEGENEQDEEDQSAYGTEQLTPHRQSVTIPVTMDLLMDASFDIESEILQDAAEAFAFGEGNAIAVGSGDKVPQGITTRPGLITGAITSKTANVIDADDIFDLEGNLKIGQNPTFAFHRLTLAKLRKLQSSAGGFLWQPGLNGAVANTLIGHPYILAPSMPVVASGNLAVAFGDFRRGYTITDRTGVAVIRDNFTSKRKAIIEFTINRWNTGRVVLEDAFQLLLIDT